MNVAQKAALEPLTSMVFIQPELIGIEVWLEVVKSQLFLEEQDFGRCKYVNWFLPIPPFRKSEELCTPQVRTFDTFWPPQLSSTKSPSHQQGTHTIHAITSLLLDSPHLQVAAHGNSDANGKFDLHVMVGPHWKCNLNDLKKKCRIWLGDVVRCSCSAVDQTLLEDEDQQGSQR